MIYPIKIKTLVEQEITANEFKEVIEERFFPVNMPRFNVKDLVVCCNVVYVVYAIDVSSDSKNRKQWRYTLSGIDTHSSKFMYDALIALEDQIEFYTGDDANAS